MTITQVSVHYSETISLPDYCNAEPGLTLTATVEEDEDAGAVREQLLAHAKSVVQEEVNEALEEQGKPAKYHDGPTYQVMKARALEKVFILPNDFADWPQGFTHALLGGSRRLRLHHARSRAEEEAAKRGFDVVDCSHGDLAPIEEARREMEDEDEVPY